MNFCYINLWSYEGEAQLLSGANFLERLQFGLVKRRVSRLVANVETAMFRKGEFEFDKIIKDTPIMQNDLWDRSLAYFVVKHLATTTVERVKSSTEEKVKRILSLYLTFIGDEQRTSMEVLNLKLQIMRLKCSYDLEFACERHRRNKQTARPRL